MLSLAIRVTNKQQGFTLLEIIIVLFLVGLVSAIALPNLVKLYESASARIEQDKVRDFINGLPFHTYQKGTSIVLTNTAVQEELTPPEGWQIISGGVTYQANGVCLGGDITLLHFGREYSKESLESPFCKLAKQ